MWHLANFILFGSWARAMCSINQVNQGLEPDCPCSTSASSFSWLKLGGLQSLEPHTGNITIQKLSLRLELDLPRTNSFIQTFAFQKYSRFLRKISEMYSTPIMRRLEKFFKAFIFLVQHTFHYKHTQIQVSIYHFKIQKNYVCFHLMFDYSRLHAIK